MGWFIGLLVVGICWFDVHLSYKLCCRALDGGWFWLCLVVVPRWWFWVCRGVLGCLGLLRCFDVWMLLWVYCLVYLVALLFHAFSLLGGCHVWCA